MDEDVWDAYFQAKKKEYKDRIEAEKKAEQERIEIERKESLLRKREQEVRELGQWFDYESLDTETSEGDFNKHVSDAKKAKKKHEEEQDELRKKHEAELKALKKAEAVRKKREAEIEAVRKKREKLEAEHKYRKVAVKKK